MNLNPKTHLIGPTQCDTWCHRQSRLVRFSHIWTIENFTYCFDNDPASRPLLWSAIISASPREKYKFYLKMYPKGNVPECKDFVSLFLNLCITGNLIVDYKFSIVNAEGKKVHTQEDRREFHYYTTNAKTNRDTLGFDKFIKRDELFDLENGLLVDDKLTIYCEISYISDTKSVSDTNDRIKLMESVTENQALEDYGNLLKSEKLSDVILSVKGKNLFAHKAILAARAGYFAAMFEHETKEKKENKVDIPDVDAEVLTEMLTFIYTGKVPSMDKYAIELLAVADKYQLDSLKTICEEALCSKLAPELVQNFLLLADLYNANKLKTKALDYIRNHTQDTMAAVLNGNKPELLIEAFRNLAIKSQNLFSEKHGVIEELK